jgi:hypothetical protein
MGKDDFDAIRRELNVNHGFAGDEFMKKLVQPEVTAWIKQNIPAWSASVRKAAGLTDVHRFWVRLLVSVIAAGTIVQKMGLLEFSMERMSKWMLDYAAKGAGAGVIKVSTGTDASSTLGLFINDHKLDIMTVTSEFKQGKRCAVLVPPAHKLLGRFEHETRKLYISDVTLRKWLVKCGVSVRGFIDKLIEQRILERHPRKVTLGAGTDYASGQTACYIINMAHPAVSGVAVDIDAMPPPAHETTTRSQRIREFKL